MGVFSTLSSKSSSLEETDKITILCYALFEQHQMTENILNNK